MSVQGAGSSVSTVAKLGVPPPDEGSGGVASRAGQRDSITSRHYAELCVAGTLEFTRLAWLSIGRVRADAHRVVHDPKRSNDPSSVHIVLQVLGTSVLEQSGSTFSLQSEHWAVLGADRSYTIMSRARSERLVIVIGREHLATDIRLQQVAGRAYRAAGGVSRLLFATAKCLVDELHAIRATFAQAMAEQLTVLLHAAARNELSPRFQSDNDVRRTRIRQYIANHLRDTRLTVQRIALELQCSRRTVARIFAGTGESLKEYVYRQRLEGARRELLSPVHRHRSLADIARSWGFRNYTHFSDRFRRCFGVPPSAIRRRALLVRTTSASGLTNVD